MNLTAAIDPSRNEQGIVIFQDRATPVTAENSLTGGQVILRGTVYMPSSALVLSGHAELLTLRIVARELDVDGTASLHN